MTSADGIAFELAFAVPKLSASFRHVFDAAATAPGHVLQGLFDAFPDMVCASSDGSVAELFPDVGNLFVVEMADRAAFGAGVFVLRVNPSDRYLNFVAALARDLGMACDLDLHGWPILSVGDRTPTVANGEGASTALPRSAAA